MLNQHHKGAVLFFKAKAIYFIFNFMLFAFLMPVARADDAFTFHVINNSPRSITISSSTPHCVSSTPFNNTVISAGDEADGKLGLYLDPLHGCAGTVSNISLDFNVIDSLNKKSLNINYKTTYSPPFSLLAVVTTNKDTKSMLTLSNAYCGPKSTNNQCLKRAVNVVMYRDIFFYIDDSHPQIDLYLQKTSGSFTPSEARNLVNALYSTLSPYSVNYFTSLGATETDTSIPFQYSIDPNNPARLNIIMHINSSH